MHLIRSVATISLFTMGSRVFGFFRSMLMAILVGAGAMSDALVIAIKIPSVMRRIFAEGAFNSAFVPIFAGMLAKEGPEKARNYAEQIFSLLIIVLSIFVVLSEIFMPFVIKILLPGFSKTPERLQYTIDFARITFPFLLFISICALFSGVLNSLERFAYAASSPMFGNISIIATVFAVKSFTANNGEAFSIGIAVCGVVQALWVMIPAWKHGYAMKIKRPKMTKDVKKFFKLLLPVVIGGGVVQINMFLDIIVGSFLSEGGISYLEYADRLNQLPLSTVGVAMGTALLPMLSKQVRVKDYTTAYKTQNLALEYALALAVPSALGLFVLAEPIAQVVYLHGKLLPKDVLQISYTLMAFSTGLPAYIMIKIFTNIFFARENTKTPVKIAVAAMLLNLALNLILIRFYQHVGLAAATAIAAWANAFLLYVFMQRGKMMPISERFVMFLPKLAFASLVCFGTIYSLRNLLWEQAQGARFNEIIALTAMVGAGVISYASACYILGIIKKSDFNILKRK
ncbi:MAG: murein biosynthesis integral membrane protein MurJ [Alphaproteobacteria bacterium]|nr:murein biosynthesis integral membrane protein MurJ [Alphaproteobacteria bacterium]NCQ66907.1 murein biosynthesis integral membrane protein MurJ [Alphaproteobacteria bacterium]NCT07475.1 murein biosynthesis integral membrane protein MurJ [Alphaproteobacteria bacterium]